MALELNDEEVAENRTTSMLDPDSELSDEGQVLSRRWRTAGVMALMALMALGFAMPLLSGIRRHRLTRAQPQGGEELYVSPYDVAASADDTNLEFMDVVAGLPGIPFTPQQLERKRLEWKSPATTPKPGEIPTPPPMQKRATLDSNDCFKGEEFFAGACYANCSNLTRGQFPIRSSPNTCCKEEPCIFPSLLSFSGYFVCMGYAVDSTGACPRQPGKCHSDEEMFEGKCYRPCASMTENLYPYRVGPMSCCKYQPPCFNIFNIKSEGIGPCSGYDVGGSGQNCSHDASV
eukprot:symbB.v1.2.022625.t1/scaffold2014.1/size92328/4